MKKALLLFTFLGSLFLVSSRAWGQADTIKHRIFLVGDAGALDGSTHPVIDWMKKNIDWDDERNIVLFLGDNIYEYGLPPEADPGYEYYKSVIDYQLSLVKGKKARAYVVPGNHDWNSGKVGGLERIKNQSEYINSLEMKNVEFWPDQGCPGPVEIQLSDSVVLVFMDSQWWLHTHEKPGLESHCDCKTQDEVLNVLTEIAEANKDRLMIIAMHHPLYSYGPHGGNYTLRHHLFPFTEINPSLYIPLPIIGSIYPITRGVFGNIQDVKHPTYRTMIRGIEDVMRKHGNAVHVAGHDHTLQYLMKDTLSFIVSASGSRLSRLKTGKFLKWGEATVRGFASIEVYQSGKTYARFYTLNSRNLNDPDTTFVLKTIVQPEKEVAIYKRVVALPDSVMAAGNPSLKGNWFRNFLMGDNYRQEWITPVKVRVLDITTEYGGLQPVKLGGGKQTKSLRLADSTGKEYSLRSIKKFPTPAMPVEFRETFVKDLVEDGISASYPYASLSMGPLTRAVGLPFLRNQLVYVPEDTSLGRFRDDFANTLCMLEEREPAFISKTYNTDELIVRLLKDNDDHVDQKRVLMGRILDMYIMDFDRHEDQWRWFTTDTGRGKIYNPIPRDRDQAFFVNQGLIPRFMKKRALIPDIQGFRPKAFSIKTFNKSARNFDRSFLNELDENTWSHMVDSFLTKMTDSVIVQSMRLQPPEIRNFSTAKIVETLRERRKYLKGDLMEYYQFISKVVSVTGSNQNELFTIHRNSDGTVLVIINKIDKSGVTSSKIYERLFNPLVTRELRIYGMKGDDRFIMTGNASKIKIRVIGGDGKDEFNSAGGSNKTIVYDRAAEENVFTGNTNYRNKVSNDADVNDYNRLNYRYNLFNAGAYFTYDWDEGFFVGLEFLLVTHGFRKDPFQTNSKLTMGYALSSGSYNFKYNGIFTKAIRNHDLVVRADIHAPQNQKNFFGIGNQTTFDKTKGEKAFYYRAKYNIADIDVLARRNMQSWMNLNYGISLQYFSMDSSKNRGKYITSGASNGFNKGALNSTLMYAGPTVSLEIDNRNNKVLPTRGALASFGVRTLLGLNKNAHNIAQLHFDLAIHMSIVDETDLVLVTRFGAVHNIGEYEFFQAAYLGGNENLRGYHNNRFAGRTSFFNNTELRIRLFQFRTYFFPGSAGVLAFSDVGKVYVPSQSNGKFHWGYGGGVWVSPLRKFVIVGSVMISKETTLPLVTFGYQF